MTSDPVFLPDAWATQLAHSAVVMLAGVSVRVESNSAAVTAAVVVRYGVASALDSSSPQCAFRVNVGRSETPIGDSVDARWHFPDRDHAVVTGPGFTAALDLASGRAIANVDEAIVPRHPLFRRTILEGIPLTLITRKDRHPVHAAALRKDSAAILLHGPSGVGKSTLAYVAHRAGIDVLADDATRVQLDPELRVWRESAKPHLHLQAHARDDFEELRELEPDWLSASGISKLSVHVRPRGATLAPFASAARVCLVTRHAGPIARRAASSAEIRDALLHSPEAAFDLTPDQRERVAAALAAPGGWHLNLSSDPNDAVPHLRDMLARTTDQTTGEKT